jgi:hypothetical protein
MTAITAEACSLQPTIMLRECASLGAYTCRQCIHVHPYVYRLNCTTSNSQTRQEKHSKTVGKHSRVHAHTGIQQLQAAGLAAPKGYCTYQHDTLQCCHIVSLQAKHIHTEVHLSRCVKRLNNQAKYVRGAVCDSGGSSSHQRLVQTYSSMTCRFGCFNILKIKSLLCSHFKSPHASFLSLYSWTSRLQYEREYRRQA